MKRKLSEYCLYLIIVALPSYQLRFNLAGIPCTVLECLIILGSIILWVEYREKITLGRWKYYMLAFALIGLVATVASANILAALGLYKAYIIEPMLVAMMLLTIKPKLEHVLVMLSVLISYIGGFAMIQYFTGAGIPAPWNVPGPEFRVTSVFDYPNAVGLLCAPIIPMLLVQVLSSSKYRYGYGTAGLLGMMGIVMSQSMGGIIAVAVSSAIILYLLNYKKILMAIVFIGLLTVAVLLPLRQGIPMFLPIKEVILFQDNSGQVRLALWQGTANLLQHHPWFGTGLAGFPEMYQKYKLARHTELLLYPHNIFLDFWVELGLAGVIWLITVLYQVIKKIWVLHRDASVGRRYLVQLAGIIAILVYGLVDVPYFKNDLAVLFWLILVL